MNDLQRSVDYLETRSDIDADRLAYIGVSWGAYMGPLALALEDRIQAAVLANGGLGLAHMSAEVDPLNFAPRVSVPVLMLSASQDFIFPVDSSQKPLFERLGTPDGHKRHVIFVGGHGNIFQDWFNQSLQHNLDWLDKYLGPVH